LIRDFIKEFWKIMEYFSKNYRHLKSKILHKFHRLLLVLFFFSILDIFLSYFSYRNLSKISKHFQDYIIYYLLFWFFSTFDIFFFLFYPAMVFNVNDGILLKFWISNISIYFEIKKPYFCRIFYKISDPYNKTTQKFEIFFENHRQVK